MNESSFIILNTIFDIEQYSKNRYAGNIYTFNNEESPLGGFFSMAYKNTLIYKFSNYLSIIKHANMKNIKCIKKGINNQHKLFINIFDNDVETLVLTTIHEFGHYFEGVNEDYDTLLKCDHNSNSWINYTTNIGYGYGSDYDPYEYHICGSFTDFLIKKYS